MFDLENMESFGGAFPDLFSRDLFFSNQNEPTTPTTSTFLDLAAASQPTKQTGLLGGGKGLEGLNGLTGVTGGVGGEVNNGKEEDLEQILEFLKDNQHHHQQEQQTTSSSLIKQEPAFFTSNYESANSPLMSQVVGSSPAHSPLNLAHHQTPPLSPHSPGNHSVYSYEEEGSVRSVQSTENLIEEMEDFLNQHDKTGGGGGVGVNDNVSVNVAATNTNIANIAPNNCGNTRVNNAQPPQYQLTAEEASEAERILEALMKGNVTNNKNNNNNKRVNVKNVTDTDITGSKGHRDLIQQLNKVAACNDNISNVSQIVTDTGEKVVIVVAKDSSSLLSPDSLTPAQSPGSVSMSSDSSDTEWLPQSDEDQKSQGGGGGGKLLPTKQKSNRGSKPGYKRGPYKRSAHSNIVDKKERKKRQNVEAARRYRDKKKNEQSSVEQEEQIVLQVNEDLKSRLHEVESELKTLKKLMVELGLIKVTANNA